MNGNALLLDSIADSKAIRVISIVATITVAIYTIVHLHQSIELNALRKKRLLDGGSA